MSAFHFESDLRNDNIWGKSACSSCFTDLPRLNAGKVGGQVSHDISHTRLHKINYLQEFRSLFILQLIDQPFHLERIVTFYKKLFILSLFCFLYVFVYDFIFHCMPYKKIVISTSLKTSHSITRFFAKKPILLVVFAITQFFSSGWHIHHVSRNTRILYS